MSIINEKRKRAINLIMYALEAIDMYNCNHEDAKELSEFKLISDLMQEFDFGEDVAKGCLIEAKRLYRPQHNIFIEKEVKLRKINGMVSDDKPK